MILEEFDENRSAVIEPTMIKSPLPDFPQTSIACFSEALFSKTLESLMHREAGSVKSANGRVPVYEVEYGGKRFSFFMASVGEPLCVGTYEDIIALGSRRLILFGNCGVLDKNIKVGQLLVVDGAIRDEGFSYHYIEPSRYIYTDKKISDKIADYLEQYKIPYLRGLTWTTDALFRETADKVELRKSEGAKIVEMEQAGCIAVAQFRGFDYGAIIYGGDDVASEEWNHRGWNTREGIRYNLVMLCKELVKEF